MTDGSVKIDLAALFNEVVERVVHLADRCDVVYIVNHAAHDQHDGEQRDERNRDELPPELFYCMLIHVTTSISECSPESRRPR